MNKRILLITVATGTISKSFRTYPSNTAGKHEIQELQRTAILGIAHKHSPWEITLYIP
jgi:hypothetical protein